MLRATLLLGVAFLFSACPAGLVGGDLSRQEKIIEMEKGPCFGRCPIFKLTIYKNGMAAYEGERYTDRLGLHVKLLPKSTFEEIKQQFRDADLWRYRNVYKGRIPDLQTVTITYHEDGESKSITGKDGRPEVVMELESALDEIANSKGWTQKGEPTYGLPDNVIANELIVQLAGSVNVETWVRRFREYRLQPVEEISPGRNYWLLTFDTKTIEPPRMLERVRADRDVVGAEFNKKGAERN